MCLICRIWVCRPAGPFAQIRTFSTVFASGKIPELCLCFCTRLTRWWPRFFILSFYKVTSWRGEIAIFGLKSLNIGQNCQKMIKLNQRAFYHRQSTSTHLSTPIFCHSLLSSPCVSSLPLLGLSPSRPTALQCVCSTSWRAVWPWNTYLASHGPHSLALATNGRASSIYSDICPWHTLCRSKESSLPLSPWRQRARWPLSSFVWRCICLWGRLRSTFPFSILRLLACRDYLATAVRRRMAPLPSDALSALFFRSLQ